MDGTEIPWLLVWEIALTLTVVLSTAVSVFIFTLPQPYEHSQPQRLQDSEFTEDDKQRAERSGWSYYQSHKDEEGILECQCSVQVVVLGDIGRSPRMQYHALSIAQHGGRVDLIGYVDSEVHPDIKANRFINVIPLPPFPSSLQTNNKLLFLILAPSKILWQIQGLHHALGYRTSAARWTLVQNPPSIPTLAVAQWLGFFRNSRLVIDWHNFGYSILALRLGPEHPLVRVAEWYEWFFSFNASTHLAVTKAMCRVLEEKWKINAFALHDRPAAHFRVLDADEKQQFLKSLPALKGEAGIEHGERNWRLIVSPTSWTPDEDFSVLLDALVSYSAAAEKNGKLPKLIAIITGKGPQKEHYLRRIEQLKNESKLKHVRVTTDFLSIADYARLLGSADLGISLHTSSSGVDLPMKVVDMFGAGLPVAGWSKFEAWPELVQEDVNGRGFESADGLAQVLQDLFGGNEDELNRLREGAVKESERRWEDEWMPVAGKLFHLAD